MERISKKIMQRSEPSQEISEFTLTEVGEERVELNELMKTSARKFKKNIFRKQLERADTLKSLSVPLGKPKLEKIKRVIAYEKVCEDISKWDPIVNSNRFAEQTVFPLEKPEFYEDSLDTANPRHISKHPVEIAVSEALRTSENVIDEKKSLTAAEEKALEAMSLEEAKLRHSELMKQKALISYREAKARRQNKIKSKRYHRLLKKEKLKKIVKEFEELKKTDKQAALEKILETDKLRILERVTLKHRNTGKWAKQQKIRSKYNPESRSNLKEDIAIGNQLREKVSADGIDTQFKRIEEYIDPDNKFFEDEETEAKENSQSVNQSVNVKTLEDEIDFCSEAICLKSIAPDTVTYGDEDLDDKEEGKITIQEAFADEDFISEFQEEKKAIEKRKREGIDLFLPGWGSWGGPGVKDSKRKRKRFFIKPLEPSTRKPSLPNVIINEEADAKTAVHQVSHLPFPFRTVEQFNSHLRQPVSHTWNPQTSYQILNAPKVVTKMGKIIEPINSEDVVLEKKNPKVQVVKTKVHDEIAAF